MLGLRGRFRVDARDEEDQATHRLALGRLRRPEAVERAAIGAVRIGEFDDDGRIRRADG